MTDLQSGQTSATGFRINMPTETVAKSIYAKFADIIIKSGKSPNITNDTANAIHKVARLLTEGVGNGFKILGPCGTGKSTLLKAINLAIEEYSQHGLSSRKCSIAIRKASEIVEEFRQNNEYCNYYYKYTLLAIDDLGVEPLTVKYYGNEMMPIVDIICRRCDDSMITIIVSNLDADKIMTKYEARVHDRLRDMTTIILDGVSNRGVNG